MFKCEDCISQHDTYTHRHTDRQTDTYTKDTRPFGPYLATCSHPLCASLADCPPDTYGLVAGQTSALAACTACPVGTSTGGSRGNTVIGACLCNAGTLGTITTPASQCFGPLSSSQPCRVINVGHSRMSLCVCVCMCVLMYVCIYFVCCLFSYVCVYTPSMSWYAL